MIFFKQINRPNTILLLFIILIFSSIYSQKSNASESTQDKKYKVCQGMIGAAYSIFVVAELVQPPLDLPRQIGNYRENHMLKSCQEKTVTCTSKEILAILESMVNLSAVQLANVENPALKEQPSKLDKNDALLTRLPKHKLIYQY